jgi:DNA (cytosine-5)-methyltransferase 1
MKEALPKLSQKTLTGSPSVIFFAGIGGWPLALRLAGVSEDTPLWTGSPPCQPFSAAGKQLGQFDPRHLATVFLNLISECRPPVIFGEQVAPAIAKSWMCDLQAHLEGEDYAVGFAVLPACSIGAPHKRERLFFGAYQLADTDSERLQRERRDSDSQGREGQNIRQAGLLNGAGAENSTTNPHHGFWSDADWLGCRDGKFRPVEPGTFPLANGIPARVGRLRGYGNAIVPQVAAEFIKAFMGAVNE